jgi:hypothetical protein
MSASLGGVIIAFDNNPVLFTFSDGTDTVSFFFAVNDLAINPGQNAIRAISLAHNNKQRFPNLQGCFFWGRVLLE